MKKSLLLLSSLFVLSSINVAYAVEINDYETLITEQKETEPTELFSGTWKVGEDIEVGRYEITTTEGQSGNLFIRKESDSGFVNDILGKNEFGGVEKVTVYLEGGEEIEISGLDSVLFTPITKVEKTDEIHSGNWIVGIDIEPGTYIATTLEGQSGNLFVDDKDGSTITNEILGKNEFGGVDKAQLKLKEGYQIRISGINNVMLEKK